MHKPGQEIKKIKNITKKMRWEKTEKIKQLLTKKSNYRRMNNLKIILISARSTVFQIKIVISIPTKVKMMCRALYTIALKLDVFLELKFKAWKKSKRKKNLKIKLGVTMITTGLKTTRHSMDSLSRQK
jgi:hypothetical protein